MFERKRWVAVLWQTATAITIKFVMRWLRQGGLGGGEGRAACMK
jgi:hypothetical protein